MQYILLAKSGTPAPKRPIGNGALPAPVSSETPAGMRKHKRARTSELMLRVRLGDQNIITQVDDISVGGVFARSQAQVPVGAYMEMALLKPGKAELPLSGIVVDDVQKRCGMAVKFENLDQTTTKRLRALVLDQQIENADGDPDVDVAPTRLMLPPSTELNGKNRAMDELRRRMSALQAENDFLKTEAKDAKDAQLLVGRLRMEIERLKSRVGTVQALDVELLGDIRRDAEVAWTAVARLSENVEKLK